MHETNEVADVAVRSMFTGCEKNGKDLGVEEDGLEGGEAIQRGEGKRGRETIERVVEPFGVQSIGNGSTELARE
jgi:hypothetical protein